MPPRRSVRRSIISLVPPEPPKAVDSVAATSPRLPPPGFPVADTVAAVLSRGPTSVEEPVAPLSNGNADVTATTGLATPRASQPQRDEPMAGPSRVRPVRTYSRAHRRAAMLKKASPAPSSDSLSSLSEPADEPPAQVTSPHAPEDDEEQEPPSDDSESEDSDSPTSKKRKAPDDDYTPENRAPKKAPRKSTGKKAKETKPPVRSESPDLPTISLFDIIDGKVDKEGRLIKKAPSKKDPAKRTPKKKGGARQTPAKPRTPAKAAGASASRGRNTAKSKAMPNPTPDQTSPETPASDTAMPWSSLPAEDDDDDDDPMDLMSIFERKQSPTPDSDASSVLSDLPPPPPEPEVFQPSELPPGAKLKGTCLVKDMHQWRPACLEEFHPAQTEEEAQRFGDRFTVLDRIGRWHKRRARKAILFLGDEAIAECRVAEFRKREESPAKSSRRRLPTPDLDLPPAGDTSRFSKLDLWKQIIAIRPHLSDILHERYAPAQWRIDAFFQSPSARNGLNRKVSYGDMPESTVAGEFIPELERWALGVEARMEATPRTRNARARSDSTTATEPRAPATGSERWESLSGQDRRDYVHLVLLPEAIIERCVRTFGSSLEAAEPAPEDDVDSANGEQADGPDDAGPSAADVQDDDVGTGEAVDQELVAQPAQPTAAEASNPDQTADATAAGENAAAAVSGKPADSPPATASAVAPITPDQAPAPKETTPVPAEPAEPQTPRIASPTPATTTPTSPQPTHIEPLPTPSEPVQRGATPPTATATGPPAPPTPAAQQRTYDAACRKLEALRQEDTDWAIRCTDINNARRAMRRKLGLPEFDTVDTPPPEMELSWAGRRRTKKNYKV